MVYNSCDPCNSNCGPGAAFADPQSARMALGVVLCQILAAINAGAAGTSNVTVVNGPGAAAVNIQDGGNSITVDGAVTVTGSVTSTPSLTSASPVFSDYPFGSITGAYTLALTNPGSAKILDLINKTNADLLISLDGVTDHFFIPGGTGKIYDLAANGLFTSGDIFVKHNGTVPTLGSLISTLVS